MKTFLLPFAAIIGLAACDDAEIVNQNLTKAADNFELVRSVSFYNTWTDTVVLQIVGVCSIKDDQHKFSVTCKEGDGSYTRRQMGRSANLTYYMDQIDGADVSAFHTRIIFKPQSLLPDIDFRGEAGELLKNRN